MIRILALLMFFSTKAMAANFTTEHRGEWTGIGEQDGRTWAIALQIVPGGARVDYPAIPCGGVWVLARESKTVAEGTEWLSYGDALCLDGLRVVLEPAAGGGLMVRWLDADGTEIAVARLARATAGVKADPKKQ